MRHLECESIYQVFPRNYSASGTLSAVTADLDRIAAMGFSILYITPPHPIGRKDRKGSLGSPYAIRDYRAIDPALGTVEDLRALAREAKARGMRLMIDVVYNHVSPDSVIAAEHPDWIMRDAEGRPARKCEDWSDVVDLDYSKRALWDYLIDTLAYWRDQGVEGFRCDVASLVPLDFWLEARKRVDPERRMAWLAESVHASFVRQMRARGFYTACDPELHRAFDMSYDYDGIAFLEAYRAGRGSLDAYLSHVELQRDLYPAGAVKARFLENHDQPRAASLCPAELLPAWTLFQLLLPGASFVFMGQEFALRERPSLFEPDPAKWEAGDKGFKAFFDKAFAASRAIKAECPEFRSTKLAEGLWALEREASKGPAYVAILNLEGRRGPFPAGREYAGRDVLNGGKAHFDGTSMLPQGPVLLKTR